MRISLDTSQLQESTRFVMSLPGLFARARISATKSTGWWIRGELRNHIEYGGEGWEGLHPLTAGFRKNKSDVWTKRSRVDTPLFWLGKYSRYLVDKEGETLQIDFGKSKKGEPGTIDRGLTALARRAEDGEKITVTDAMRRKIAATKKAAGKKGAGFFLRKGTSMEIPKRPVFAPVMKKIESRITPYWEEKFWAAYDRYIEGKSKK